MIKYSAQRHRRLHGMGWDGLPCGYKVHMNLFYPFIRKKDGKNENPFSLSNPTLFCSNVESHPRHNLSPSSGACLDEARVHCLLVILLAKLGGAISSSVQGVGRRSVLELVVVVVNEPQNQNARAPHNFHGGRFCLMRGLERRRRMKKGGGATMPSRASALLVAAVLLTVQAAADNATYKACHTGDGKAHLYNCGPKFDHNDDKIAQLEAITSPTRFVAYTNNC